MKEKGTRRSHLDLKSLPELNSQTAIDKVVALSMFLFLGYVILSRNSQERAGGK